jgi:hypothetical protein
MASGAVSSTAPGKVVQHGDTLTRTDQVMDHPAAHLAGGVVTEDDWLQCAWALEIRLIWVTTLRLTQRSI